MRVKKTKTSARAKRPVRAARSKKPAAVAHESTPMAWSAGARAMVFGAICVFIAVALLSAREDTPADTVANVDAPMNVASDPVVPERQKDIRRQPEVSSAVAAKTTTVETPEPTAPSRDVLLEAEPETSAGATLTGCLESDEGEYRLTNVSGDAAPTSRSWKSGFFKKRPASIEISDAVGTLGLRHHLGRRVTATGTLVERDMRARSVRVVGVCD